VTDPPIGADGPRASDYGACVARERLAALRVSAGFSQERLAERLDVDRTTVGRWEQGRSMPQPWQRRQLAHALDLSLDELDAVLGPAADQSEPAWQDDGVNRRAFLAGVGGSIAGALLQLEDAALMAGTEGLRRSALLLLGHGHRAAGDAAFERLDLASASGHFRQAFEVGVDLGDADMVAHAQIQQADVARRQGRYGPAVALLDAAGRHASAGSLTTRVARWQTLARAHAEMGDRTAFRRAIGRAEDLASGLAPEHHRGGDQSPRGVRLERGQGLTVLGEPEAALAIYDDEEPVAFGSEQERGSYLIILAQALAHARHLDEGVRVARAGVELAQSYRSARHVSRVQRMYRRLLRTWSPDEPALIELREILAG
jgi:transcriptional regulator with XRE-family HTH domain